MNKLPVWFGFFVLILLATCSPFSQADQAKGREAPRCASSAYRSFDFWIGDWNAIDAADQTAVAHVVVESVLGGCAVREQYTGTDGTEGESLSAYEPSSGRWHQYWVSNTAEIVSIEGNFESGAMVLAGEMRQGDKRCMVRGSWKREAGGVREIAERSSDGGKTWQAWFDLLFRRVPSRDNGLVPH